MKRFVLAMLALSSISAFAGDHYRQGYVRKDGTYVAPSYQTNPNDTKLDNYSSKGNVNPYTGKEGTVDPYKPTPPAWQPAQPANIWQQPKKSQF